MKSGTSSLCGYLSEHRGNEACLQLSGGATNEQYLAERSTRYTKRPFMEGVAGRIHQFSPDARLVYIMVDRFVRLVSQHRHRVSKHMERSFGRMMNGRPQALTVRS